MPIKVSQTADGIGIIYTSAGVLTGQDLLEADERLGAEIQHNPAIRYLLVDHSAILEQKIDTKSLRVLAERMPDNVRVLPEGLVAIVAPNDILFGLSRMWAAMADHPKVCIEITRTAQAAIEWLEEELRQRQLPFRLR